MSDARRPMTDTTRGEPRVFPIADLKYRANSETSRSARAVTPDNVGSSHLQAGMFWSDKGSVGGWSFGDHDPHKDGAPWVGVGEEVYLCLQGRVAVEWEGGSFEFGAGDIVFWPNNNWFTSKVISDEPVQMLYVMAPPPTSMWGLGGPVSSTGDSADWLAVVPPAVRAGLGASLQPFETPSVKLSRLRTNPFRSRLMRCSFVGGFSESSCRKKTRDCLATHTTLLTAFHRNCLD